MRIDCPCVSAKESLCTDKFALGKFHNEQRSEGPGLILNTSKMYRSGRECTGHTRVPVMSHMWGVPHSCLVALYTKVQNRCSLN